MKWIVGACSNLASQHTRDERSDEQKSWARESQRSDLDEVALDYLVQELKAALCFVKG